MSHQPTPLPCSLRRHAAERPVRHPSAPSGQQAQEAQETA